MTAGRRGFRQLVGGGTEKRSEVPGVSVGQEQHLMPCGNPRPDYSTGLAGEQVTVARSAQLPCGQAGALGRRHSTLALTRNLIAFRGRALQWLGGPSPP